jgi:hypothetical protein
MLLEAFTLQQDQLTPAGSVSCAAAPQHHQLAWMLDGLLVLICGQHLRLCRLQPLQLLPVMFQRPSLLHTASATNLSYVLPAVAASPHGVAVAAVVQAGPGRPGSSSSSRLLVYNVPQHPADSGSSAVEAAAGRLLWVLMQHRHCWDVVQQVLLIRSGPGSSSTSSSSPPTGSSSVDEQAISEVLRLVDAKLAVQQLTLKSSFSVRWDAVKLAVLDLIPSSIARTVSMDLRLRFMSHLLRPVFDVVREVSSWVGGAADAVLLLAGAVLLLAGAVLLLAGWPSSF